MQFAFIKKIAGRYLWSRKGEAFINVVSVFAVLGVAIGVAVLNITMSIMTGFEKELHTKLVGNSHIYIGRVAGQIYDMDTVIEHVQAIEGIEHVTPYVQGQVMISSGDRSQGLLLKGINKEGSSYQELLSYGLSEEVVNKLFTTSEVENTLPSGEVVIAQLPNFLPGEILARRLGLYRDQPVSILTPKLTSGPLGLAPRYKRFVVADFYKSGLSGYDEALAYTSLEAAQKFFRVQDSVTGFEVGVTNPKLAPQLAGTVKEKLRELKLFDFVVQDWTQLNKGLWEAIGLEKRVYFIVLLLLIVLASFSIITTLVMIVLEKRKDIAVMRTFGASSKIVSKIFMLMGASIGLLGTLLGAFLGLLGCLILEQYGFPLPENVFPTSTVPVSIDLLNFVIVSVSAFIICLLATIYPARKAGTLEPSEILRYE